MTLSLPGSPASLAARVHPLVRRPRCARRGVAPGR
jgi:hypothetical protein